MEKKTLKRPDYILISAVSILVLLGIAVLAGLSATASLPQEGNSASFLFHQLVRGLFPGFLLGFIVFRTPLKWLKKQIPLLLLLNLILMALVFFPPTSVSLGGARRWFGFGPISFQPSEFLKITFILYLAAWLSSRTEKYKFPTRNRATQKSLWREGFLGATTLIPFLVIIGFTGLLLVLQPHISTLAVISSVAIIMYFLAETPAWHTFLIGSLAIAALVCLIRTAPYRLNRLLVFLQPDFEPMGMGYQVKQSLIAIGSGGLSGLGLGMSIQKLGFLPYPMSDSVFSIFAEETGFIGSLTLLFLFLILAWRGLTIAKRAGDGFSRLAAGGITAWILLQAFVNIGAMVGLLPLTGIPLPFISYGGSHLMAELIGAGVLLSISKEV